jgi:hypothetical protein
MKPLPTTASDEELLHVIDAWVALLEAEDYQAAFNYTEHDLEMGWTPELIREVIKSYGEAEPGQRVTLAGQSTDIAQRKEVLRWPPNALGEVGEIWYDLNLDGFVSDLTARFRLCVSSEGVLVRLHDIHVM